MDGMDSVPTTCPLILKTVRIFMAHLNNEVTDSQSEYPLAKNVSYNFLHACRLNGKLNIKVFEAYLKLNL